MFDFLGGALSFLGDIGSSVGSIFSGGLDAIDAFFGGSGSSGFSGLIGSVGGALGSAIGTQTAQTPYLTQSMNPYHPKEMPTDKTGGPPGKIPALSSVDPRQLEEEWMARMGKFRHLGLITKQPSGIGS